MIATYQHNGVTYTVQLERQPDGTYRALVGEDAYTFRALPQADGSVILAFGVGDESSDRVTTHVETAGDERHVAVGGEVFTLSLPEKRGAQRGGKRSGAGGGSLTAQMPGQVREVLAEIGAVVERGQTILLLEAMKMEIRVTAPQAGTLTRLLVSRGDVVERGQVLAEIG